MCTVCPWKAPQVRGPSKPSESRNRERVRPSLVLSPPSMSRRSLGASTRPQPSSPALLCEAFQGLPFLSNVIFLAGMLVLSLEDVCYFFSLKRKKKKYIYSQGSRSRRGHWSEDFIVLCSHASMPECVTRGTAARDANKTNRQHLSNLCLDAELRCTSWRVISLAKFSFLAWQRVSTSRPQAGWPPTASGAVPHTWGRAECERLWGRVGKASVWNTRAQWALSSGTASRINVWGSWVILLHRRRSVAEPWFSIHVGQKVSVWVTYSSHPHPPIWVIL